MASDLGTSVLTLKTDTKQCEAGIDSAKKRMEKVGASMQKVGAGLSAVGAGFALALSGVLESADKIGKASGSIGVDVERLQGWFYAADTAAGVSSDSMVKMFGKLSDAIDDAGSGGKTYGDIFEQMGIAVKDSEGNLLSADEVLLQLADRFAQGKVSTEEMAAVQGLLGGKMVALINLFKLGSEGVNGLITESGKYGVMTQEQIDAAEDFNDAMTRLGMAFKGLMFTFLDSEWMKWLTENVEVMALWIAETAKANPWLVKLGLGIGAVSVVIGPLLIGLGLLVASLKMLAPLLFIAKILVMWKVYAAVAIAVLLYFIVTNKTVHKVVKAVWAFVVKVFKGALQLIVNVMKGLVKTIVRDWKFIVKIFDSAMKFIWNGLKGSWKLIIKLFSASFNGIINGVKGSWNLLVKIVKTGMKIIWNGLKRDWNLIIKIFSTSFNGIINGVTASWEYIVNLFKDAFNGIINGVTASWKYIVNLFKDALLGIGSGIKKGWEWFTQIFSAGYKIINDLTLGKLGSILESIKQFITGVGSSFSSLFNKAIKIWGDLWASIGTILFKGVEVILTKISNFGGAVVDYFRDMFNAVVGNSIVPDMVAGISNHFTSLGENLVGNNGSVKNTTELVSDQFNTSVISVGASLGRFDSEFNPKLKTSMKTMSDKNHFAKIYGESSGSVNTNMGDFFSDMDSGFGRFGSTGDIGIGVKNSTETLGGLFGGLNTKTGKLPNILTSIKGGLTSIKDHGLTGLAGVVAKILGTSDTTGLKGWKKTVVSVLVTVESIWSELKSWIDNPDKMKALVQTFKDWYGVVKDVFGFITDLFKKGDDKKGNTFSNVIDIFKDLKDSIFGAKEQMDALNTAFLFFMGQAIIARYMGFLNIGFTVGGGGILSQMEFRRIDASTFASSLQLNDINKNTSDLYESFERAYGVGTTGILNDIRKNTWETVAEVETLREETAQWSETNGQGIAEILWDISADIEDLMHLTDESLNNNGKSVSEYLAEQTGHFEDTQHLIEEAGVSNDEWLTKIEANTLKTANNTEKIKDDIAGGVQINQPITVTVGNPSAIRSSFTGVSAQSIGTSVTSGLATVMARENTRLINAIKDALKKNTGGLRSSVQKLVSETS